MKTLILLFFVLIAWSSATAQGCLPEGISFYNQSQIDNFQANYPGCTEIEGDVVIADWWWDITNLNGLNVLTSIGGDLRISNSVILTNLTGLENLTSIGGDLQIGNGGQSSPSNDSLTSLTGLDNLTSIGGNLTMSRNYALASLSGLANLTSVGGSISIRNNNALASLSGLDNINAASITDLNISDNNLLSTCDVQSICSYLASPNGVVNIYSNASGCDNPTEIANNCGISLPCLPYGNYYFLSQADIDSFPDNFTGCIELEGTVSITGNDITNLGGLNQVTNIEGNLKIGYDWGYGGGNPVLNDLSGLDNLVQINGSLWITHNNYSLTSLEGLENLIYIGGDLWIGVSFVYNPSRGNGFPLTNIESLGNLTSIGGELLIDGTALTNFSGLENLTSIGGPLEIVSNDFLISLTGLANLSTIGGWLNIDYNDSLIILTGLDNINPASITSLWMLSNHALSTCAVQSICESLAISDSNTWIAENAPGCNSQAEVQAACAVSISEVGSQQSAVNSYPNPFSSFATIEYELGQDAPVNLTIYNHLGQQVAVLVDEKQAAGRQQVRWNAEGLPSGLYFYRIQAGNEVGRGKMVLVK